MFYRCDSVVFWWKSRYFLVDLVVATAAIEAIGDFTTVGTMIDRCGLEDVGAKLCNIKHTWA
jgi:hypothetical protein